MSEVALRAMQRADWPEVAALIHAGTNAWYERHARPRVFTCAAEDVELFCRVYEDLDPGCCVLAESRADGRILGSCFYHPRPTHVSLGIMNVRADAFGAGVASRLLRFVTDLAARDGKPVRLVSSAMNLDSYSLYNRAGFAPRAVYQDMLLAVPEQGMAARPPGFERVRDGRAEDAAAMAALEREQVGIDRERDFRYFLANREGVWHVSVVDGAAGLAGFLVSVKHPASRMLGPGVMRDEATAAALVARELEHHRGGSPVWLAPADRAALLRTFYGWGARNCELHLQQVLGDATQPTGVVMPTFLPETG